MFIQFPLAIGVFYIQADDKLSFSFNTHWFQKTEKRKKKRQGLRDLLLGPICRLWRKRRTTTTTGRSDSYDNGIKFGSPDPRSLARRMLALLYPLGTRAKLMKWSTSLGSFVRFLLARCTFGAQSLVPSSNRLSARKEIIVAIFF